jgi:hypothetical protein
MIRRLVSASHLALAHSGEAVIRSRQYQDGVLQQTSTDHIQFSGKDWNDSVNVASPAAGGQPATSESAINRAVGGQAYDYFTAADRLAWYHDTGPDAISSMHIPDPRKLLAELAPGAGFIRLGHGTIGGVQVEHLQATVLARLPAIQLSDLWKAGQLATLDAWVDGNGVVRQMSLTFTQASYPSGARHKRTGGKVTVNVAPERSAKPQTQVTSLVVNSRRSGSRRSSGPRHTPSPSTAWADRRVLTRAARLIGKTPRPRRRLRITGWQ